MIRDYKLRLEFRPMTPRRGRRAAAQQIPMVDLHRSILLHALRRVSQQLTVDVLTVHVMYPYVVVELRGYQPHDVLMHGVSDILQPDFLTAELLSTNESVGYRASHFGFTQDDEQKWRNISEDVGA